MAAEQWWEDSRSDGGYGYTPRTPHGRPRVTLLAGSASVMAAALDDVAPPAGYLSRVSQRGWQELLQEVVFRAILDAAKAPCHSEEELEALRYLRDPENAGLFRFAGLPPAGVKWAVRSRDALRRTAQLVERLNSLRGMDRLRYWQAMEEGRAGGAKRGPRGETKKG